MSFFDDCIDAIGACGADYLQFKKAFDSYQDIIILGNGGSNAIASHISQDYTKRAGKEQEPSQTHPCLPAI
jgi:phosphoheptose isomerase